MDFIDMKTRMKNYLLSENTSVQDIKDFLKKYHLSTKNLEDLEMHVNHTMERMPKETLMAECGKYGLLQEKELYELLEEKRKENKFCNIKINSNDVLKVKDMLSNQHLNLWGTLSLVLNEKENNRIVEAVSKEIHLSETSIRNIIKPYVPLYFNRFNGNEREKKVKKFVAKYKKKHWDVIAEKQEYQNEAFEVEIIGLLGLAREAKEDNVSFTVTSFDTNQETNREYIVKYLNEDLQKNYPNLQVTITASVLKITDKETKDVLFQMKVSCSYSTYLNQFSLKFKTDSAKFCYGDYFLQKENFEENDLQEEKECDLEY